MNVFKEFKNCSQISEVDLYKQLYERMIKQEQLTYLGLILQHSAQEFPNSIAIICESRTLTYAELYARACGMSNELTSRGIKSGDRVLLLMENSIEFYIFYFGIIQIGAVVVPVNTFLHERELAHIIHDADPVLFICSSHRIEKIREYATHLPPVIDQTCINLEESVEQVSDFVVVTRPWDEMVALLYTSGTTGFPKGVMLSSKNILTNVLQVVARFRFVREHRIMAVLPLFHSLAQNICLWSSITMGLTIIVVPKIDRKALLKGFEHKPTIFVGVPALFGLMCLMKTIQLDSVEYFFSGGDALPDKIRAFFSLIYRRKICSGYGITETSPVISVDMDDKTEPTNSTGTPLVGIECRITADDGKELPDNNIGNLWIKGDNVMLGYYNAPDITETVFSDGWFDTGDLAYFDNEKKLVITGRVKDLIINKGIKIYPQEVENIILLHPNVMSVGVVGLDEPESGQVPVAFVQVKGEVNGIEVALKELCDQHLAPYKVPRQFICSGTALPVTATGKVDKKVLRKQLKSE